MKWQGIENDCVYQRTTGENRAHKYYYIWEMKEGEWIAGRYWFSREMDYGRKTFPDSASARAYCEKMDKEAVIIEAVTV